MSCLNFLSFRYVDVIYLLSIIWRNPILFTLYICKFGKLNWLKLLLGVPVPVLGWRPNLHNHKVRQSSTRSQGHQGCEHIGSTWYTRINTQSLNGMYWYAFNQVWFDISGYTIFFIYICWIENRGSHKDDIDSTVFFVDDSGPNNQCSFLKRILINIIYFQCNKILLIKGRHT